MNKITKRLLSLACCAVMLLGMLPGTAAAASENTTTSEEVLAVSTLPQLAAPTDLEWGYRHLWDGSTTALPGTISWKPQEPTQSVAKVSIYREGETKAYSICTHHFGSTNLPEWRSVEDFCLNDLDSGTYYFTVTARGDNTNYCDSETVTSSTWTYTKPSAQLGTCSDLSWNWPYASYAAPTDTTYVGGYEVDFFFSPNAVDTPESMGTSSAYTDNIFEADVWDDLIQECGIGYYYFKVRPLSSDITVICNGDWSELSPAFNLTTLSKGVAAELENVVVDKDNLSDDEIRDAVQSIDTVELESAMLADQDGTGIMADIAELEDAVGGTADIMVTNDAYNFDADKISIVGANLNNSASAEESITLVIDKPEEDHVIDATYDNSVAVKFSMDLDNVEDSQNLAVPVKITLPIPATINPEFLVILHYHADGSVEELLCPYTYQDGDQWYASFVLTSFSDFVMTQLAANSGDSEQIAETTPMYRLYNPNSGEHFYTGSVEEKDMLVNAGWQYEGIAWNAPTQSGDPVYRLYNPNSGDHHYTMSAEERDNLVAVGWIYEGVAWNSASSDNLPLYRLYNPNADCGSHHYTGSTEERDNLVAVGWIYEGIGWFGTLN